MSKLESNNKPIIALMYDFDKTLCTKDMDNIVKEMIKGMAVRDRLRRKSSGRLNAYMQW